MGIGSFFRGLFGLKPKEIPEFMDMIEPGDGDEEDLTSIAYYKRYLRANRSECIRISGYVEEFSEKFDAVLEEGWPQDSARYQAARNEKYRWIVDLDAVQTEKDYIRQNTQEDIEYRERQYEEFPDKLKAVLPPDFDLRFHSTSIGFTRQILESKSISSTPFRFDGYIKNSDGIDNISASNREDISRTIRFYAGLREYQRCLPAGCVFALLPKDQADIEMSSRNEMGRIDFLQNPQQLFGIFTTPENIKRVKEWMRNAELDAELVYTYEEFLQAVEERAGDKSKAFRGRMSNMDLYGDIPEENLINADPDLVIRDNAQTGQGEDYTQ